MINKPDDPANDNYPCADCGAPLTETRGGTTFIVCDTCWDNRYKKDATPMTERCSEKADELLCSISYGHSQADSEIRRYIAALESSVAELTQRAESAEALVREVAELDSFTKSMYDRSSNFLGLGCWECGAIKNSEHEEYCVLGKCKRHAEEQR